MMAPSTSASQSRDAVLAALSDVVTVDSNNNSNLNYNSQPPPPPLPEKNSNPFSNSNSNLGMGARLAGAFRRAAGQDKESKRREKAARMKEEIDRSAAKTSRMDIIDRLDLSGIHGSSMFHHDSPYDAVSPHRNRHAQKAPVKAFDPNIDPMTGKKKANGASSPLSKVDNSNQHHQTRPSFSSRATTGSTPNLPILNSDGTTSNNGLNQNHLNESNISFNGGSRNPSSSHVGGRGETDSMTSNSVPPSEVGDDDVGYYQTPSNQAEIWGVSSEPWQDFASPKQSSKDKNGKRSSKLGGGGGGGKSSYLMPGKNGSYDGNNNPNRSGISSSASSVMDMEAILTGKTSEQRKLEAEEMKRRADNDGENLVGSGVSPFPERDWSTFKDENDGNGGGVRRNKSLIKRIKSARQSPNVPPPDDVDDVELSSLSNNNNNDRRYGGNGRNGRQHKYSPSTPPTSTGGGVDSHDSSSNNYAFQGYGNNDGNNNRMERKRGLGGSMRIRTRGLSPASGNHSSSPGGNGGTGGGEGSTPTGSTAPSQDYLTVKGEDERRGRSNSNNSSPGATNGQGLGRSGSLFGRFGRKGKGSQKAQ